MQAQNRQDAGYFHEAQFTQPGVFQGIQRGTANTRFTCEHRLAEAQGLASFGNRFAEIGEGDHMHNILGIYSNFKYFA
ncbi:hypothetical protein METEAL_26000 [Mesoterricola silvestris]|uniref:Uncharacterized protein n=1 Tax=Mesoterricola silvestris TaxID=2927979 RepID=A0AA48GX10_9BACT|nr:hypothetical protein METEAL_26000 [Mesoterricola silvestris]